MSQEYDEMQALIRAAKEAQVEADLLIECLQRRLISLHDSQWNEHAIEEARRVRRMMALGVNLPGIEVIFHMRQRAFRMQQEIQQLHDEMARLQQLHQREINRLLREITES
ncbi:MAG: hypothetical protein ACRERD_08530 [Candidatus Binatia bacterium]